MDNSFRINLILILFCVEMTSFEFGFYFKLLLLSYLEPNQEKVLSIYTCTYVPSQINSNFTSQTFRNQFCEALEQQNHMILWDGPISKITWFLSPNSNTVICSLNSIMRFLVCWLGPWPVIWVFRVQIPPKSLITYTFTEIFKNWLFLFLSNPTLDSQYRANQLPKTVFRLSGISK